MCHQEDYPPVPLSISPGELLELIPGPHQLSPLVAEPIHRWNHHYEPKIQPVLNQTFDPLFNQ